MFRRWLFDSVVFRWPFIHHSRSNLTIRNSFYPGCIHRRTVANRVCSAIFELVSETWNHDLFSMDPELTRTLWVCGTSIVGNETHPRVPSFQAGPWALVLLDNLQLKAEARNHAGG